jgi:hypothetical protein
LLLLQHAGLHQGLGQLLRPLERLVAFKHRPTEGEGAA